MTITDLKMIHILLSLGLITVIDLLMRRLGNEDVTNWCTNLKGRSKTEI